MNYIKLFEEFTGDITKQADIVYKDSNLLVIVPKTFEATRKFSRNTQWCSNNKTGFYSHITTANLFRFHFKDGYKLRLTWDYIPWDGDYSSGTHWGQGGKKDGKLVQYLHIRPTDENKPFDFDYTKGDDRQFMVDRINSIPEEARKKVIEYHNKHSIDKNDVLNKMYSDIQKIKIIDVENIHVPFEDCLRFDVLIDKDGDKMTLSASSFGSGLFFSKSSVADDDSGMTYYDKSGFKEYITDKLMAWSKVNNVDFYNKIKKIKDEEVQS